MDYIKTRCEKCTNHDPASYNALKTGKHCTRDFPRTYTKEDCKIRLYKKAPWQDAFIEKSKSNFVQPIKGFKNMDKQEKLAALKALMKDQVSKAEKKGSELIVGIVDELPDEFKSILQQPTGYPLLDKFTNGGFPSGGQTTISGAPGVGKTSLALMLAGSYQKQDKIVLFLNFESILDHKWAQTLGVDTSELILVEGKTLEDGLIAVEEAVNADIVDLIIVDSLDSATPRGEFHKKGSKGKPGAARDLDDDTIALKARVMSQFYRRVAFPFRKHNTSIIMIGQHRTALGGYIAYEKMGGGLARQYADILYLKLFKVPSKKDKSNTIEQDGKELAYQLRIKVEKSKYSGVRAGKELFTYFFKNCGFNPEFEYVSMSLSGELENSPLVRNGASTSYIDSQAVEHKLRGSKPNTIYSKMIEEGYMPDFLEQIKELNDVKTHIEQNQNMADGTS
jgi:recombination protein RecA